MSDIYEIPHATSVFVDRSRRTSVLRVLTEIPEHPRTVSESEAKRQLTDALEHTATRLGVRDREVTWMRHGNH